MRHRGRVRDEALDTAERFGKGEVAKSIGESLDRLYAAGNLEAGHRAEARLLAPRDVVPDVRGESWVVEPPHRRMLPQRADHRFGVLDVLLDAHVQRAQATQREIAVEGRSGDAERVTPPLELIGERRVRGNDASADDVAVPIQVL